MSIPARSEMIKVGPARAQGQLKNSAPAQGHFASSGSFNGHEPGRENQQWRLPVIREEQAMNKGRICALAALVAAAMVSEPVLARGGSHGGGHHSSHSSYSHGAGSSSGHSKSGGTGHAVAGVVKAVAKAEPKRKTNAATARRNDASNDAAPGQGDAARTTDCPPPKPVFDSRRGICIEQI